MGKFTDSTDRLDTEAAICALRAKGIEFWIENGNLRYKARRGATTAEDVDRLRQIGARYTWGHNYGGLDRFESRSVSGPHNRRLPLAFSQLHHWELRARQGHSPVRQIASATRVQGLLDECALSEIFALIVSRHESLRTNIVHFDKGPLQEISEHGTCELEFLDLTSIAPSDQWAKVRAHISSVITDVTDYAKDPLLRAILLKLGKSDSVLILAMDHMVSDGVSLGIIQHELWTAHAQALNGDISLPATRMQFGDYALWQRECLSEWLGIQAATWERWKRTRFPVDLDATGPRGWGVIKFVVEPFIRAGLEQWSRKRKTSTVMAALTAYIALISRWCDESTVSIQVMSDGRINECVQNMVGYVAFPIYMRVRVDDSETFVGLLKEVTKSYCEACDRPDFYYSYVRNNKVDFVCNSCFNWIPRYKKHNENLSGGIMPLILTEVAFMNPCLEFLEVDNEPCVLLRDRGKDVVVEVEYPRARFSEVIMQRFAATFRVYLRALMNAQDMRLRDVIMT